jgi:hypothetical protein
MTYPYLPWGLMPVTTFYHLLYVNRQKQRARVQTYFDKVMASLWLAVMVTFILLHASPRLVWAIIFMLPPMLGYVFRQPRQVGLPARQTGKPYGGYFPGQKTPLRLGYEKIVSYFHLRS